MLAENGPVHDFTFVLRAFSALHEGCLTLPLWVEPYDNCKFSHNLNNFYRPFHCYWVSAKSGFEVLCSSLLSFSPLTWGLQQLSWIQNSLAFQFKCHHSGSTLSQHAILTLWKTTHFHLHDKKSFIVKVSDVSYNLRQWTQWRSYILCELEDIQCQCI